MPLSIEDRNRLSIEADGLLRSGRACEALGILHLLVADASDHPMAGLYQMLLRVELLRTHGLPPVGPELSKSYMEKLRSGFFDRWLSGPDILDIGYRGSFYEAAPVLRHAKGIDQDTPGYDGLHLPFADNSQDGVFACHCLEHMDDMTKALAEWMRVVRPGGHLVVIVPHQHLYEKRRQLPSPWNADHKHFITPARLLTEVEAALPVNGYRLRHLADNDFAFNYALGPERHSVGCYEIEMVLEKRTPPAWSLA